MHAPYNPKAIANYFLSRAEDEGQTLDPIKLQKLVYNAHGWYMAMYSEPLIDETVEAWPYGPVIPTVYHEFKRFGAKPIRSKAIDFHGSRMIHPQVASDDEKTRSVLDRVWKTHRHLSGMQLSHLSHRSGSPWKETWQRAQRAGKKRGVDIPDELIETHFREKALRNQQRVTTS